MVRNAPVIVLALEFVLTGSESAVLSTESLCAKVQHVVAHGIEIADSLRAPLASSIIRTIDEMSIWDNGHCQ